MPMEVPALSLFFPGLTVDSVRLVDRTLILQAHHAALHACEQSGITELQTFTAGLAREEASIRAALSEEWSTGQVEGQITRLKLVKRQM